MRQLQSNESNSRMMTARNFLAALFRRKKTIVTSFLVALAAVIAVILVFPDSYTAEMKVLVDRERLDAVITTSGNSALVESQQARVTQQDVNSEVDLLQSPEILRQVVIASGLNQSHGFRSWLSLAPLRNANPETAVANAIRRVQKRLRVDPPNQSNLITVRFTSDSPDQSLRVLNELSRAYSNWHVQVHQPSRKVEFFRQQADHYNAQLKSINQSLTDFSQKAGSVAPGQEKTNTVQQISELEANLTATQTQEAELRSKIEHLRLLLNSTSERHTSQVKTSPLLLEQLKGNLFTLLQKKTELLQHYSASYRGVQEIDAQIAALQQRIDEVSKNPTTETTTEIDPAFQQLRQDLVRTEAELAALDGRAAGLQVSLARMRTRANRLETQGMSQDLLLQAAKSAESNYLMYVQKQEEARISDALNQQRFINVTIAEAPVAFAIPDTSLPVKMAMGLLLSIFIGLFVGVAADYFDPTFRSSEEVENLLHVPVLATLPRETRPTNGHAFPPAATRSAIH